MRAAGESVLVKILSRETSPVLRNASMRSEEGAGDAAETRRSAMAEVPGLGVRTFALPRRRPTMRRRRERTRRPWTRLPVKFAVDVRPHPPEPDALEKRVPPRGREKPHASVGRLPHGNHRPGESGRSGAGLKLALG